MYSIYIYTHYRYKCIFYVCMLHIQEVEHADVLYKADWALELKFKPLFCG